MRRPARLQLALLALLFAPGLGSTLASGARAQGHPVPEAPEPLHLRLHDADAAAVVRVETVEPGRLHVARLTPVHGDLPARFAIKRAPSAPPALEAGDRALVALRGVRAPYVLDDPATDAIRLADDEAARLWGETAAALVAGEDDPVALARAYSAALDSGPPTLTEAGFLGLTAVLGSAPQLRDEVGKDRVRAALDPRRSEEARRMSAILAARTPAGAAKLMRSVARDADASPALVLAILQIGVRLQLDGVGDAFRRAARHPDAEVRLAAVQAARPVSLRAPELVVAELTRLATEEPEEGVRQRAEGMRAELARGTPRNEADAFH